MSTPKNPPQIKSISASMKKGPAKGLKHILANPSEIIWPILRGETGSDLKKLLSELLPEQKCSERPVSWAQKKRMSKEERASLKKDTQVKNSNNKVNSVMNELVLGINAVTKYLENEKLCSIIVDSTIDPLFMVKHIVTMGETKSVPVLLVPFLKSETLGKIGFACAAIGLKKTVESNEASHFHKIHLKILEHSLGFPRKKTKLLFEDSVVEDFDDSEEEKPFEKNTVKSQEPFKISTNVYKYRSSKKERGFIPPNIPKENSVLMKEDDDNCGEFISLGNDVDIPDFDETLRGKKKNTRYMDVHETKELDSKSEGGFISFSSSKDEKLKKSQIENEFISFSSLKGDDLENKNDNEFISKGTDDFIPIGLSTDDTKNSKEKIAEKRKSYVPLKVKKIQGNAKRFKATKTPKPVKKNAGNKK